QDSEDNMSCGRLPRGGDHRCFGPPGLGTHKGRRNAGSEGGDICGNCSSWLQLPTGNVRRTKPRGTSMDGTVP
ncbi:MAG: hypothetical protein ACKPKO_37130, partial [Candidatus Fonsibacter sp.]